MPRTLYITTELPYFPGQGGLMAMHMRHLSQVQTIGVVGPRYPDQPERSLQLLRDGVGRSYWWPENPSPGALPRLIEFPQKHVRWIRHLLPGTRKWLFRWLTGLIHQSDDALAWRIVLTQLAPKILEALGDDSWNSVLLSQSTSAVWLPFLPSSLATCIYFHDIRSDYLPRATVRQSRGNLRRILREERRAARDVEAIAVVSELDRTRADDLLKPSSPTAVAPICVDPEYFSFQPPRPDAAPVVLFTGHLSHPPNVDAAVHFLGSIWPKIIAKAPDTMLRIVGLQPAAEIKAAVGRATNVQLIPNVPDIRPYFREARVYVVPMRYGGGVRQKILEAWAMGLPVVTTRMGAEGLAAEDGRNCWLRDEPDEFASQALSLLQEPAPAAILDAARKLVLDHHSLQKSSPPLASQIEASISRRRYATPKILFDVRWLDPGKVGGVEQMTNELINELGRYDRSFEYRILGSRQVCGRWRLPPDFRHRTICTDSSSEQRLAWRDAAINELANGLALPSLMTPELRALEWYARLDFTLVHGLPCHVHPDLRRFPSVVTMHDLQHLHLPQFFTREDFDTREREYRASCRVASHVICTSEFTRQDVHERYGVPLEKMTTVWNLPPRLTETPVPDRTVRRLLHRMGVKPPFLFYPAQPWLHKNHRGLLEAMLLLDRILPRDYKLVMTSQPFSADHPAAVLLFHRRIRHRVVHLGYREPLEIAALYRAAEAMIFPSLFEGFGLPLIEAMQQGCPVVCGFHSALPEIAGDAALYTDVTSPEALARSILAVTRDDALRARLREIGAENLRRFDRRALAEKTRAIYASVHDQHFA